jgi:hypothetical protein
MKTRILVGVVFLVGCGVGGMSSQLAVPKASAQQAATLTKWEYRCTGPLLNHDYALTEANKLGAEGWDAITVQDDDSSVGERWCFKRPKM